MRFRPTYLLIILGFAAAAFAFVLWGPVPAAIVYAAIFFLVAWQDRAVALMLIFAVAPFQMNLAGAGPVNFSIAEVNLLLIFPIFLLQKMTHKGQLPMSPITIPVFLYLAVCLVSSLVNWRGSTTLISFVQMVEYLVVAVMIFSSFFRKEEDLYFSLQWFIISCVFLAIVLVISRSQYILGLHKNGIGRSLASALIVCVELWFAASPKKRKWFFLATGIIAVGLLFSVSRGAWLGAFCGLLMVFVLRGKFKFLLRFALIMIPLIAFSWNYLPQDIREYATDLSPDAYNVKTRLGNIQFAQEKFEESPVYGVGVGLRKEFDSINVIMSTLAETGVIGLLTFLFMYFAFFWMVWKLRRRVSQKDPLFSLLVIGSSLMMGVLAHGQVDHYWSRGGSMIAWAGAGMAISVYYAVHRRLRVKLRETDANSPIH